MRGGAIVRSTLFDSMADRLGATIEDVEGANVALDEDRGVSLRQHIAQVMPEFRYITARARIVDDLQALADGKLRDADGRRIDRIMIRAPPQLGKTTIGGLFASWFVRRFPSRTVGMTTYNKSRAGRLARAARSFYLNAGGRMSPNARSQQDWETMGGGGIWCYSINAGQTGNPASLLLIDDPVKDEEEANSELVQKRQRAWYGSSWLSRWAAEYGRLIEVFIGTSWCDEDLSQYVLDVRGATGPDVSPYWYVIALQGVYLPDEYKVEVPAGCILAEDWREPGEGLAPELDKFTAETVMGQRAANGGTLAELVFSAMWQAAPKPSEGGGLFAKSWPVKLLMDPQHKLRHNPYLATVRAWDLADTEGTGNWCCGVLMSARADPARYVVRHAVRGRRADRRMLQLIAATMLLDGPNVTIEIPIDPAAGGKFMANSIVEYLRDMARLVGMRQPEIQAEHPRGKKVSRVRPFCDAAAPVARSAAGVVEIPGMVELVTAHHGRQDEFRADAATLMSRAEERGVSRRELLELEVVLDLRSAIAETPTESLRMLKGEHIECGEWWEWWTNSMASITNEGGGDWDTADATADAHRSLTHNRIVSRVWGPGSR